MSDTTPDAACPPGGPASAGGPIRPRRDGCEAALLAGLRAGEETAFEGLVRAYGRPLLSVARRFLRDPEDARDAVQDAFLLAFRGIDSFQEGAPLSPWLHRILINVSISRLRARRPTTRLREALCGQPEAGWHEASDAAVLRRETRARVRECIHRLPGAYRAAVQLRYIKEMDTEETARALGVSANAVKGRLHRARLRMRALLGEPPRAAAG